MQMDKVLILTDGKAGHENQSKAFARALGCDFDLVEVHFKSGFAKALSYLYDHLGVRTLSLLKPFALPVGAASSPPLRARVRSMRRRCWRRSWG